MQKMIELDISNLRKFHKQLKSIANNDSSYTKVVIKYNLQTEEVKALAAALSENHIIKDLSIRIDGDIAKDACDFLSRSLVENINIKKLWLGSVGKVDSLIEIAAKLKDSHANFIGIEALGGSESKKVFEGLEGNNKIKGLSMYRSQDDNDDPDDLAAFTKFLNNNPQLEELAIASDVGFPDNQFEALISVIGAKNHLRNLEIFKTPNQQQKTLLIEALNSNNVFTQFVLVMSEHFPNLLEEIKITEARNIQLLKNAALKASQLLSLNPDELNILEAHAVDDKTLETFPQELRDELFFDSKRIERLEMKADVLIKTPNLIKEITDNINNYASMKHFIALDFFRNKIEVTSEISENLLQLFENAPSLIGNLSLVNNVDLIANALKNNKPFTEIITNTLKLTRDQKSSEFIMNNSNVLGFLITRDQNQLDSIIKNIINDDYYFKIINGDYKSIVPLAKISDNLNILSNIKNSPETLISLGEKINHAVELEQNKAIELEISPLEEFIQSYQAKKMLISSHTISKEFAELGAEKQNSIMIEFQFANDIFETPNDEIFLPKERNEFFKHILLCIDILESRGKALLTDLDDLKNVVFYTSQLPPFLKTFLESLTKEEFKIAIAPISEAMLLGYGTKITSIIRSLPDNCLEQFIPAIQNNFDKYAWNCPAVIKSITMKDFEHIKPSVNKVISEYPIFKEGIEKAIFNIQLAGISTPPARLSIEFNAHKNIEISNFVGYLVSQSLIPGITCATDMINGNNNDVSCYSYYKNSFDSSETLLIKTAISSAIFRFSYYQGSGLFNAMIAGKLAVDSASSIMKGDLNVNFNLQAYSNQMLQYLAKMYVAVAITANFEANPDIATTILIHITPPLIDLGASIAYQGVVMLNGVLNPNGDHIDF